MSFGGEPKTSGETEAVERPIQVGSPAKRLDTLFGLVCAFRGHGWFWKGAGPHKDVTVPYVDVLAQAPASATDITPRAAARLAQCRTVDRTLWSAIAVAR